MSHLRGMGKVGLIGLGRMGKGMAHRIQGGGHELTVSMSFREARTEFGAAGRGSQIRLRTSARETKLS